MEEFKALEALNKLEGRVVVVTGGGNGIGAAVVRLCVSKGAAVIFGDVAIKAGQTLQRTFNRDAKATFIQTDVTTYESILHLFNTALEKYGKVDHAISCAGLIERPDWFDLSKDVQSVQQCPPTRVLDVNLTGSLYFSEIAVPFLRHGKEEGADKSIVLISSIAGFQGGPGLPLYTASKHGILGLMRCMCVQLYATTGIRTNAFCPFGVATGMIAGMEAALRKANVPVTETEDAASIIMQAACEGSVNGKAFYLEGGRAWDIEEPLARLMPQWVGERQVADMMKAFEIIGADAESWTKGYEATKAQSA